MLKQQDVGGSIVFIASKNALVAGKNAAAYSSAKAAELHLARCLAEEGGADGIRVNTVNPDAVLQGSKIWGSSWREERAAAYNLEPDELDEHYRQRNTLKVNDPARRHRRGGAALRLRAPLGQVDRQHPQRRRRRARPPTRARTRCMRVALFITCFNDTLFPEAGRAVVEVLERLGCEVEFPLEQTCCGQMHVNSGYEHEAGGLLARFSRVFDGLRRGRLAVGVVRRRTCASGSPAVADRCSS